MRIFLLGCATLIIAAYTCLFAYALYKEKNTSAAIAVGCIAAAVIASPFVLILVR